MSDKVLLWSIENVGVHIRVLLADLLRPHNQHY